MLDVNSLNRIMALDEVGLAVTVGAGVIWRDLVAHLHREELGEPELGFLLVCSADFDIVEELPNVELSRSQTIMQGASHCDFRYRFLQAGTGD